MNLNLTLEAFEIILTHDYPSNLGLHFHTTSRTTIEMKELLKLKIGPTTISSIVLILVSLNPNLVICTHEYKLVS